MLYFQQSDFTDINITAVLQNINWYDPWIIILIMFHVSITTTTFLTRTRNTFQVIFFVSLLLLVYCSENINEIASNNWRTFSTRQYFDRNGLFISLVFCIPILLNCMIMIANWLYQSRVLMAEVKLAQLRAKQKVNGVKIPSKTLDKSPSKCHVKSN